MITYTQGSAIVTPKPEGHVATGSIGLVPAKVIKAMYTLEMGPSDSFVEAECYDGESSYHLGSSDRRGLTIEVRGGAYPDGMPRNEDGAFVLPMEDYDVKWRAWYGDPYPEQCAAEPWPDEAQ